MAPKEQHSIGLLLCSITVYVTNEDGFPVIMLICVNINLSFRWYHYILIEGKVFYYFGLLFTHGFGSALLKEVDMDMEILWFIEA